MKPLLADLYAFEKNIETAVAAVLKAGGLNVVSTFIRAGEELNPIAADFCTVLFETAETDAGSLANVTDSAGQVVDSIEAGFQGDIVITHSVPVTDLPPDVGMSPGCYEKICRQRGMIRALMLGPQRPFGDALSYYSILSLRLIQPERRVDAERSANSATERFRLRFVPAPGML